MGGPEFACRIETARGAERRPVSGRVKEVSERLCVYV